MTITYRSVMADLLLTLLSVEEGYRYTPGDSDLDDEQPIHVRMTLGDYRRAIRLKHSLADEPAVTGRNT